jgi:hypothetical protein
LKKKANNRSLVGRQQRNTKPERKIFSDKSKEKLKFLLAEEGGIPDKEHTLSLKCKTMS